MPSPLIGVSSGVGNGEAVLVNTGDFSEGYGVAVEFEGVSSGVGNGEVAVSGKAGDSSGAGQRASIADLVRGWQRSRCF